MENECTPRATYHSIGKSPFPADKVLKPGGGQMWYSLTPLRIHVADEGMGNHTIVKVATAVKYAGVIWTKRCDLMLILQDVDIHNLISLFIYFDFLCGLGKSGKGMYRGEVVAA
jgi:hypothetical protein